MTTTGIAERQDARGPVEPERGDRRPTVVLGACVVLDAAWLATTGVAGWTRWVALVVVVAVHVWCVVLQRRNPTVDARTVVFLAAGLAALAAVLPVHGSKDVWSYAMTGRIIVAHHANPYTHPPSDYGFDPLFRHVSRTWWFSPNAYGPAFQVVAAAGAVVAGTSPLLSRLWYQAIAAVALVGGLAFLARRRTPVWALLLIGLAPATLATVNGAHIDLLVGLGALVGLTLIGRRRLVAAGIVLGVAALVKFNVLPAVFGAGLAFALARQWRAAVRLVGTCAGVVVAGYAAMGTSAFGQVRAESGYTSRTSVVVAAGAQFRRVGWSVPVVFTNPQLRSVASVALAVAVMVVLAWRHRRAPDPVVFGVAALLVYVLAANYALAWYPALVVLALGLVGARLRWIGLAAMVLFQAAFIAPVQAEEHRVPHFFLVAAWSPLIAFGLLVAIAWLPRGREARAAVAARVRREPGTGSVTGTGRRRSRAGPP